MGIYSNVYCSNPANPAKIAMPDSSLSSPYICIVLLILFFYVKFDFKKSKM